MSAAHPAAEIRNFAIVGHQASGKTLLAEAMLATSGVVNRIGSIDDGTTVSDYHEDEKQRKISIHSSILHTEWLGQKFNFVDTPGYLDFISEGLGALRVGDFALVVVDAVGGVELGTRQVWAYATQFDIPKILVINGLDKEHADFEKVLGQLQETFGSTVFPMNLPVNPGPQFNRVLDVMRNEVCTYAGDLSGKFEESKAGGEWDERVHELHKELIEYVAESDDSLLEHFFEKGNLTEDEMRAGIHAAVQNRSFIPCFCASAIKNVGVARLMDFIAKYGSSPVDRRRVPAVDDNGEETTVGLREKETCLYVFKTISEPHVGELSFVRLYSGSVKPGLDLHNTDRNITERIGQIFVLNGKNRESVDELKAGDIGAFVKLKDTHTGNTLCDPARKVALPRVEYPRPNIHGALELEGKGDEDKVASGLSTLHEEDPTFLFRTDPEIGQLVLSGQGELHLQIILERLKRRYGVNAHLIEPKVPYRETIKGKAESKYRHKKQSGGAGQFAEVWMRVSPGERDSGVDFQESLVGQNVDRVFVPSVEKGVQSACIEGILAGCRVVDVKVDFYDGKMHPVDSKDVAFQIAGRGAFREAFLEAKPCLLEPIMNITVRIPEEFLGDVMGDISSRRGRIQGMDSEAGFQIVKAQVPQKELYRYSTTLRSLTGGRGLHMEEFSHYEEVPRDLQQKIIAAASEAGNNGH